MQNTLRWLSQVEHAYARREQVFMLSADLHTSVLKQACYICLKVQIDMNFVHI